MMWNYCGGAFGGLMMVVFWVAVALFIVWVVREVVGSKNQKNYQKHSALDILKERYAKGEIGREEFESKKKDIVA